MTKKFFTDVCNVDFSDQRDTTRKINGWVSNKTNEMIPELLKQPLKKDTYLALINTLYFKGKWQKPFPKYSTSENTFKPLNQPVIKIPMMQITDRIDYGKFSNFKVHVISKEFSNPRFTFVVILPIESGKLQYPERFLRGEVQLPNLMKKLHPTQVYLKLPRFRMDSSFDLIETLGMLGITDLFDSVLADMKGITEAKIYADVLQQSTALKVNEEGVEASAANILSVGVRSMQPPPRVHFIVNESFVCFIYDKILGTPLFAGRVVKPVIISNDK
ncbi:unnamed protein product [Heterobilharzia americana]|nr:unnamed protein product [Heterobilharzia americana]